MRIFLILFLALAFISVAPAVRAAPENTLPDIAPYPISDLRFATVNKRTVLRFTSSLLNQGNGPFVLIGDQAVNAEGYQQTSQRIVGTDGQEQLTEVGEFLWHDPHKHYHYKDFADYVLELIKPFAPVSVIPETIVQKTTFCLYDTIAGNLSLPEAARTRVFTSCGKYQQGVSVGWADQYLYNLPDQYIDVQDKPAGVYRLSFEIDPFKRFVEKATDNNRSDLYFEMDPAKKTIRVLAAFAAFPTRENIYSNGTLIRANGDNKVFVLGHGQKRWLKTEEIFHSYGYNFLNVLVLPKTLVDAIPPVKLIRLTGTSGIHLINENGYRRKILTPEILASYGLPISKTIEVNKAEFDAYPETDLVSPTESDELFSLSKRKLVGTVTDLSPSERASVHEVNKLDLSAYAAMVVATDLNVPWDVAHLPDGDMLVTERPGVLKRLGKNPATFTVPKVKGGGEGGLMGIAVHPQFSENSYIYLYFTSDTQINRVTRFRLTNDALTEDKIIIDGIPSSLYHDGGQIVFGPDGMLYLTTGDAEVPALSQNLSSLAGKTLRLTPEGAIPSDNPFGTAVWSYGHRNAQGITWDTEGRMWQSEHGRSGALSGFDELNLVQKGKNYGWPTSQGDSIQNGTAGPIAHSGATTTWAPSGIAFTGGRLFFAGLRGSALYVATPMSSGAITGFGSYFTNTYGRLRAVTLGPDGFLYITTSNRDGRGTVRAKDDKLIRIAPDFLK